MGGGCCGAGEAGTQPPSAPLLLAGPGECVWARKLRALLAANFWLRLAWVGGLGRVWGTPCEGRGNLQGDAAARGRRIAALREGPRLQGVLREPRDPAWLGWAKLGVQGRRGNWFPGAWLARSLARSLSAPRRALGSEWGVRAQLRKSGSRCRIVGRASPQPCARALPAPSPPDRSLAPRMQLFGILRPPRGEGVWGRRTRWTGS